MNSSLTAPTWSDIRQARLTEGISTRGFANVVSALSQREIPKGGVCGRSSREQKIKVKERKRKEGRPGQPVFEEARKDEERERKGTGREGVAEDARSHPEVRASNRRDDRAQVYPILCCACEGGKSVQRFGDGKRRITRGMPIKRQTHFHTSHEVRAKVLL